MGVPVSCCVRNLLARSASKAAIQYGKESNMVNLCQISFFFFSMLIRMGSCYGVVMSCK